VAETASVMVPPLPRTPLQTVWDSGGTSVPTLSNRPAGPDNKVQSRISPLDFFAPAAARHPQAKGCSCGVRTPLRRSPSRVRLFPSLVTFFFFLLGLQAVSSARAIGHRSGRFFSFFRLPGLCEKFLPLRSPFAASSGVCPPVRPRTLAVGPVLK